MTDFRYRSGNANPVNVPVLSATVITHGDMVFLVDGTVKPLSGFTWDTDLATTQEAAIPTFLGVAMQQSRAGDTDNIQVARGGVFEFDTASATYALGATVGPAKATGNALENKKVAAVASAGLAVGRVIKAATSATKVLVEIESGVFGGIKVVPAVA